MLENKKTMYRVCFLKAAEKIYVNIFWKSSIGSISQIKYISFFILISYMPTIHIITELDASFLHILCTIQSRYVNGSFGWKWLSWLWKALQISLFELQTKKGFWYFNAVVDSPFYRFCKRGKPAGWMYL